MMVSDILCAAENETKRFQDWLAFILKWECEPGEIQIERLNDGAGLTFAGLTSRDEGITADPSQITPEFIIKCYRDEYWEASRCENLPKPVGEIIGNFAVNCGCERAAQMLQMACCDYGQKVDVDGAIGDKTLNAAWKVPDYEHLALSIIAKGRSWYKHIGIGTKACFLQGWINRTADLQKTFIA